MDFERSHQIRLALEAAFVAAQGKPVAMIVGIGDVGKGVAAMIRRMSPLHHLVLVNRGAQRLAAVRLDLDLSDTPGGPISTIELDPGNPAELDVLKGWLQQTVNQIDLLVLAAGCAVPDEGSEPAYAANRPNWQLKTSVIDAVAQYVHHLVVVGSMVTHLPEADVQSQIGYRTSMRELETRVSQLQVWMRGENVNPFLAEHVFVWPCQLVQGATAEKYKGLGFVHESQEIWTPQAHAEATLWPFIRGWWPLQ